MSKPKYEGKMVVIDADKEVVATLRWLGDTTSGEGTWDEIPDERMARRITDAIARNADLAEVDYSEMLRDGVTVRGWEGFSGYLQALDDALSGIGLEVDLDRIQWPVDPEVLARANTPS